MSEKLCVLTQQEVLEKQFTIYGTFDKPLFLAKDVAISIGYEISNVSKLVKNVDEDEKIIARINNTSATFLTEDGLYEVLMLSRKPIAKDFKKQIKKILKGLRKGELKIMSNELSNNDMHALVQSMVDSNNNTVACVQQVVQMMGVLTQLLQNNITTTNTNTTPQTETQTEQDYITSCVGAVTGDFYTMTQIAKDITKDLGIRCDARKLNSFLCDNNVITRVKGYEHKDRIYSNFYIITKEYRNNYETILTVQRNATNGEFYLSNSYRGNFRLFVIKLVKNNKEKFLNS